MSNYINVTFSCNEYYLMAKLLTDSYKMENILSNNDTQFLNPINLEERKILLKQFREFISIAQEIPAIQELLGFGNDFDKIPDEQKGEFNDAMFARLERISEVTNNQELMECENKSVMEAFELLKDTDFFKSMLVKTEKHRNILQKSFEESKGIAEEKLKPILRNLPEKQMDILVLPPEIFDTQVTLNSRGNNVKSVASYPNYFEQEIPNSKTVAMLHEMMHTYIPLNKERSFSNETQELVYDVINHCLVELSSNCELGMSVCGLESYFKMPMHNEIMKKDFMDTEGIKKDFYIKQGVKFPKNFEFESITQYNSIVQGRTVTKKEELSNDKIRGIIYPYFLAYKNKESENPTNAIIEEMSRDKKAIMSIYGENFYNSISSEKYLTEVFSNIGEVEDILQLNDMIAERVFGIEREHKREFLEMEIGKDTVKRKIEGVDLAKRQYETDRTKIMQSVKHDENQNDERRG